MNAGFWHTKYFQEYYWPDDYWQDYGAGSEVELSVSMSIGLTMAATILVTGWDEVAQGAVSWTEVSKGTNSWTEVTKPGGSWQES